MKISWSWASSLEGSMLQISPRLVWRKAQILISSSNNLVVDVMIWAIPRYCPICALLNQFYPLLSTNTSISLRLSCSDLLLLLETFNKEDILICSSCWSKHFLYQVTRHKKPYIHAHNFSVSFSLSLSRHQYHHLNRCQAICINTSSIFSFGALRFW